MSVRGTLGGVFASVAVLVIGWQIGAAALDHPTTTASTSGTGSSGSGSSGTGSGASTPSPSASASSGASGSSSSTSSSALKDGSYTGSAEETPYGTVEVAITVSSGRITDVTTPVLDARDFRSQSINSQAVPMLKREVLAAQSAQVDMVSGATFTSQGYLTSLQAAIDKAK